MVHQHEHHHSEPQNVNTALLIGIFLNAAYVVSEAVFGFVYNSLSLLSDAGHNLTDVLALILSLLAFRLMKIRKTGNMSYGYRKASILISLLNSIVLLATVAGIFFEAFHRFFHPASVPGLEISIVALVGVGVNFLSAGLFHRHRHSDINMRGAYLHLLADALVSVGVVVSGVLMYFFEVYWLDPLLGIIVGLVILKSTWGILRESFRLSLDGIPSGVDVDAITRLLSEQPGVASVSHLHVWALSSEENALTVHIHLKSASLLDFQSQKTAIREKLRAFRIHHATFETELDEADNLDCSHS